MGRTGVFITAMSEIERVKVEGEVDIFQTVKAIRVQRPNMVSTVVSYNHLYMCKFYIPFNQIISVTFIYYIMLSRISTSCVMRFFKLTWIHLILMLTSRLCE